MTYGKLNGEALVVATNVIKVNGRVVANPKAKDYKAAGYLPVDATENPPEGYRWNNKWEISGEKIVKKYDPIPQEEQEYLDSHTLVSMTQEEAEAFENMEQTLANAQAATETAQAAAQAAQEAAETAQQEAAEATAAKEAAEATLADVNDIISKVEEVFG